MGFLISVFEVLSSSPVFWAAGIFGVFSSGIAALIVFVAFRRREAWSFEVVRGRTISKAGAPLAEVVLSVEKEKECKDSLLLEALRKMSRVPVSAPAAQREIAAWLENEFWARLTFPDYVSGILILLGLMGTLFGLSGTVLRLGAAAATLSKELDPAQGGAGTFRAVQGLLDQWNSAMDHTSTAFTASLAAVFLTVLFSFVLAIVRKSGQRTLGDMQTFLAVDVFPRVGATDINTGLDSLVKVLRQDVVIASDLKQKVVDLIVNKEIDFQYVATMLRKSDDRSAEICSRMDLMISGQGAATEALKGLAGNLREQLQQSQQVYDSGWKAYAEWDTRSRETNTAVNVIIKDIRELVESMNGFFHTSATGSLTGALDKLTEKVSDQAREFNKFGSELSQMTSAIQGSSVTLSSIEQILNDEIHEHHLEKLSAKVDVVSQKIPSEEKWADMFTNVGKLAELMTTLEATATAFGQASSELAQTATSLDGLSGTQNKIASDVAKLNELIYDLVTNIVVVRSELVEGKLAAISNTSKESAELMKNQLSRVNSTLKAISESPRLRQRRLSWPFARNNSREN